MSEKTIVVMASLLFLVSACALFAETAEETVAAEPIPNESGKCGPDLYWVYDGDSKTLTINGTGKMKDYEPGNEVPPWKEFQIDHLILENGMTSIGKNAFNYCSNISGTLAIPDSVTLIDEYAFHYCENLTGPLAIPENVKTIGDGAFEGCDFDGILTLPSGLTKIGSSAFWACDKLNGTLTIPDGVTVIEEEAFGYCKGFSTLVLHSNIKSIGKHAFFSCGGLTGSLTIPDAVETIEGYAFNDCSKLTALTIPNGVSSVGEWAFSGCGFKKIVIGENATGFDVDAFKGISFYESDGTTPITDYSKLSGKVFEGTTEKMVHNDTVCQVTFDDGMSIRNQIMDKNTELTEPEEPTRAGYVFKGWFIKGQSVVWPYVAVNNVTIKAVWEKIPEPVPENNAEGGIQIAVAAATGIVCLAAGIGGTYFFMRKR